MILPQGHLSSEPNAISGLFSRNRFPREPRFYIRLVVRLQRAPTDIQRAAAKESPVLLQASVVLLGYPGRGYVRDESHGETVQGELI